MTCMCKRAILQESTPFDKKIFEYTNSKGKGRKVIMFLLKLILAVVGLAVIALAIICFMTEITATLGLFAGIVGVALVSLVFKNDAVMAFFWDIYRAC